MDTSNKDEKSKVIAQIDVNVHWIEDSVNDHLNCVLCGSELIFKHKTDFVAQTVVEEACCGFCKVRNRQSDHTLQ